LYFCFLALEKIGMYLVGVTPYLLAAFAVVTDEDLSCPLELSCVATHFYCVFT
jgi:hypothetical protein